MKDKKCPQCKSDFERVKFDLSYGVEVESLHCKKCGFNMTDDKKLKKAVGSLRERMSKGIKIIEIGSGLGVRFPNEVVKSYNLKRGEEILLKPEFDGIRLVTGK